MLRFYCPGLFRRRGSVYFVLLCATLLRLLIEILCPRFRGEALAHLNAALIISMVPPMVITRGQKRLSWEEIIRNAHRPALSKSHNLFNCILVCAINLY